LAGLGNQARRQRRRARARPSGQNDITGQHAVASPRRCAERAPPSGTGSPAPGRATMSCGVKRPCGPFRTTCFEIKGFLTYRKRGPGVCRPSQSGGSYAHEGIPKDEPRTGQPGPDAAGISK
jgi:hypothetical protein